jgi:hypothetical protein
MKTKVLYPFVLFALLVLAVGLACSINVGTTATSAPPTQAQQPQQPQQQPTNPPPPTQPPAPTVPPVTATEEIPAFFTEDFISDSLPNWTYYVNYGDANKMSISVDSGYLDFEINAEDTSVYLFYDPYIYTDVILEAKAENRGMNNNNVSLVCRLTDPEWYEFSIANNGLYWIYAHDASGYNKLYDGGSTAINQGKGENVYTIGCVGDTLSLYINGVEVKTLEDKQYRFREGQVGINVTSFNVTPIKVEFDYLTIAQP